MTSDSWKNLRTWSASPAHALVLSCDEKSQIQALDRTQPGLPLKKGRAGTLTHDHQRHGTTTLFAVLNTLDGTVVATQMQRHRHQEWLRFPALIERQPPKDRELHLIMDNYYAPHKHPKVKRWLKKHPRFHMHFTPTSASWLNAVERFFRNLTERQLRRGVFKTWNNCRLPSPPTSRGTTKIRARSSGPPKPRTFWKKLNAPAPSSIRYRAFDAVP